MRIEDQTNVEILKRMAQGDSTERICREVFISKGTFFWRLGKMKEELECKTIVHLISEAIRKGII